jgi:general secretion pathway protein L
VVSAAGIGSIGIWLGDFLSWWGRELASLLPGRVARAFSGRPPIEFRLGGDEIVISSPAGANQGQPGVFSRSEWPRALESARHAGRRRGAAKLLLAEPLCLLGSARAPAAARARLESILGLEIERTTPFRRPEVCLGWRVAGEAGPGSLVVRQALVKRAVLEPLVCDLREAGFERILVCCNPGDGFEIPIALPRELAQGRSPFLAALSIANRAGAAVLALALCAGAWFGFARQREAIASLDEQIVAAERQAVSVRRAYDAAAEEARAAASVRAEKASTPSTLAILAELTRALPDGTWATDLAIKDGRVSLAGFSQSSAQLISALDRSELFEAVEFASPVVRTPGEDAERFNLSFQVLPNLAAGSLP